MPELMPYYGMAGDDPRLLTSRGYVAPNVSDFGEVISSPTPEVDWDYITRELATRDMAEQFAAKQEFQRRVSAGEPAENAIRELAPRLFSNARDLARFSQYNVQPEVMDVGGVQVLRTGPSSYRQVTQPRSSTAQLPEETMLQDEIRSLRRQYTTMASNPLSADPAIMKQLQDEIAAKSKQWVESRNSSMAPMPQEPLPIPQVSAPRDKYSAQQEMFNQISGTQGGRMGEAAWGTPPAAEGMNPRRGMTVEQNGRKYRFDGRVWRELN